MSHGATSLVTIPTIVSQGLMLPTRSTGSAGLTLSWDWRATTASTVAPATTTLVWRRGQRHFPRRAWERHPERRHGLDWAIYSDAGTSRVVVDLRAQKASGGGGDDSLSSIEIVDGSKYNDILIMAMTAPTRSAGATATTSCSGTAATTSSAAAGTGPAVWRGGDDVLSEVDAGNSFMAAKVGTRPIFRGANGPLERRPRRRSRPPWTASPTRW